MMVNTPPMLQLPQELILRVASYLTTEELGAFRRSCHYIETSLFDSFAKEFFTKRQFMLEQVSLETLVGIANHPTLAPYLTELLIGLDGFAKPNEGLEQAAASENRRTAGYIDRDVLSGTGRARDLLVEALPKFPNLRIVGLRDYDGRGRSRDGELARWRSYGWSHGYPDTATAAQNRRWNLPLPQDESLLPLLFLALGLSGCRPPAFEAILRRAPIQPHTLGSVVSVSRETIPVLQSLTRVLLNLHGEDQAATHGGGDQTVSYLGLKNFLSHTTNLTHLRLNLQGYYCNFDDFLTWFQNPGTPFAHLHQLSVLELGIFHAKPINLINMITMLNLKSLSLWKIALACEDHIEFQADPSIWTKFLSALSRALPPTTNIQSILVGQNRQRISTYGSFADVKFADHVTTDENGERKYEGLKPEVRFRKRYGDDVRQWLSSLSEKVYVTGRDVPASYADAESDAGSGDDSEAVESDEGEEGEEDWEANGGAEADEDEDEDEGMDA